MMRASLRDKVSKFFWGFVPSKSLDNVVDEFGDGPGVGLVTGDGVLLEVDKELLRKQEATGPPREPATVLLATLELQLAEKARERIELQIDLQELQKRKEALIEAESWASLVTSVEESVESEEALMDPGAPWEVGEELRDEVDYFFTSLAKRPMYASIRAGGLNGSGVDIIGSMEEVERTSVGAMFDRAVSEQGKQGGQAEPDLERRALMKKRLAEGGLGTISADWAKESEQEFLDQKLDMEWKTETERLRWLALSEKYRQDEYEAGRWPQEGHRVPWAVVEAKVEALMGEILRERAKLEPLDDERRRTASTAEVLRLPKKRDAAGADDDADGAHEASGVDVPEDVNALILGIKSSDAEIDERVREVRVRLLDYNDKFASLRAHTNSIRFSAEELIRDHHRWCQPDKRLPYQSVAEFRAFVRGEMSAANFSLGGPPLAPYLFGPPGGVGTERAVGTEGTATNAGASGTGQNGASGTGESEGRARLGNLGGGDSAGASLRTDGPAHLGTEDSAEVSQPEGLTTLGAHVPAGGAGGVDGERDLVGEKEEGGRDVVGKEEEGGGREEEIRVILRGLAAWREFPWRTMPTLQVDRAEALEMRLRAQGFTPGQTALNASKLAEENVLLTDIAEEAESDWKFFEPERYFQYKALVERREGELQAGWKRKYDVATLCAEADVALDEFVGILIHMKWAKDADGVRVASEGMSALSGTGRELGLDPQTESALNILSLSLLGILASAPLVAQVSSGQAPGSDAWQGILSPDILAKLAAGVQGGLWDAVARGLVVFDFTRMFDWGSILF